MKPGKRAGNARGGKGFAGRRDGAGATRFWDVGPFTALQRCIHSHDTIRIFQWYTPAYSAIVALSLLLTIWGAAMFPGLVSYAAAMLVTAIISCGAVQRLQLEGGANSVEARSRSRDAVCLNCNRLYTKWVEPLLELLVDSVSTTVTEGQPRRFDLKRCAVVFGIVSAAGEAAKYVACSTLLSASVCCAFVLGALMRAR